MTGLIASELRKLTSTITTWIMTGIGLLLVLLVSGVTLLVPEAGLGEFQGSDAQVAFVLDQVGGASIIVLVVALLSMTTEFRHGTIGRTLQITPSRTRLILGKLVAGTAYAVAFLVIGLALAAVILLVASLASGVGIEVGARSWRALWYGFVGLTLTSWFGVALGSLIRSQVVALTVTLVWLFVVENAFMGLAPQVGRWLPFSALNAVFVAEEAAAGMGPMGPQLLEPVTGLVVYLGYVVVAALSAAVLLRRRDV